MPALSGGRQRAKPGEAAGHSRTSRPPRASQTQWRSRAWPAWRDALFVDLCGSARSRQSGFSRLSQVRRVVASGVRRGPGAGADAGARGGRRGPGSGTGADAGTRAGRLARGAGVLHQATMQN